MGQQYKGGSVFSAVRSLPALGQEDWFRVEFPMASDKNLNGSGVPTIDFAINESNAFRIAVFNACGAGGVSCGSEGGVATNRTAYRFDDSFCAPTAQGCTTRNVAWPTSLYIRVTRVGGADTTCAQYQLRVAR